MLLQSDFRGFAFKICEKNWSEPNMHLLWYHIKNEFTVILCYILLAAAEF